MIELDGVSKSYPDGTVAVDDMTVTAPTGKLTVFVGPSGCGKTTTLRMINRMIEPSRGQIRLNGQAGSDMDPALLRRRVGYVIQHAGLFPHRTAVDNVAALPRLLGTPRRRARTEALELLERVGLSSDFARRYPWQLSGGQQQRVGVARALATDPEFMLMDEPFSAVDPVVRDQLQQEFLRLQRDLSKTIVMITHDIDEALTLADRIVVLRQGGRIAQVATPAELLAAPADDFVADFVGRDRGYRALGFTNVAVAGLVQHEPTVRLGEHVSTARVTASHGPWVLVVDATGAPLGWVDVLNAPATVNTVTMADVNRGGTNARAGSSLRELLDATLSSPARRGVVVAEDGTLLGTVALQTVVDNLDRTPDAEPTRHTPLRPPAVNQP